MPKPVLSFLHCHISRHGTKRYYVKLNPYGKGRGIRVGRNMVYRSPEFMAEYHTAMHGAPLAPQPITLRPATRAPSKG